MKAAVVAAILFGCLLISASILFIGHYQISAYDGGMPNSSGATIFRLDRWTGRVDFCQAVYVTPERPPYDDHYYVNCLKPEKNAAANQP